MNRLILALIVASTATVLVVQYNSDDVCVGGCTTEAEPTPTDVCVGGCTDKPTATRTSITTPSVVTAAAGHAQPVVAMAALGLLAVL